MSVYRTIGPLVYFLLNTLIVVRRQNRLNEAVLTSTHNLLFRGIIRKNVYPCKPQFNYKKVRCKGVFIKRTRFRDDKNEIFS